MRPWMLIVGAAWACGVSVSAQAADLHLNTEEYPPFNYIDPARGHDVVGVSTEIVTAMFARSGLTYSLKLLPWKRAYNNALTLPGNCVYSTSLTEDRKPLFRWVGPLVTNLWTLFSRPDDPITLDTLEGARGKVIGGYSGDAVAEYLMARGFDVRPARKDHQNALMLAAGRTDLWATGDTLGRFLARREGIGPIKPVLNFNSSQMYLACNRQVDDDNIRRLQAALETLKTGGQLEAIRSRYD